ncbi:MAG: relaxase MobL [Clostridia bacterium]|nr:relaxase MobL [Clostridia bacterium]
MSKKVDNVNFFVNFYRKDFGDEKYKVKREYYSSNKAKDYLNYVMTGIDEMKKLDYVEYMGSREKSRGVFNGNGVLNSEDRKVLREHLRTTNSVIWDCLITFTEGFGKKWCDCYEQAYNLMKNEFPRFLKSAGLNPNNIEWFAGLHENTDNRHIHISFFEKEPQRIRPNKKGKQFSMGKLSLTAINKFKAQIELAVTDFKAREILARKQLQDHIKDQLNDKSGKIINRKLLALANNFPMKGSLSYASSNMQFLKPEIDCLTDYLIGQSNPAKDAKEDFINLVRYKDEMFEGYCKRNKCKKPFTLEKKYMQDIYRRLGNIVIDYALQIKKSDTERLRLNAKHRREKIAQKNKLWGEIKECFYLTDKFAYETIKAFQDHMDKLEELRYQNLALQSDSSFEM